MTGEGVGSEWEIFISVMIGILNEVFCSTSALNISFSLIFL